MKRDVSQCAVHIAIPSANHILCNHVNHVPFSDELLFFTHNLKQLVAGLLAVTSVEKVLEWYWSLQCADYI